jgi:hypothetical protein
MTDLFYWVYGLIVMFYGLIDGVFCLLGGFITRAC